MLELDIDCPGQHKVNVSCCTLRPRTTPSPEENSILGVMYGVLLWADMNTATPLGARGRSVIGGATLPFFVNMASTGSTVLADTHGSVCCQVI